MSYHLQNKKVQFIIKHWGDFTNIELAQKLEVKPRTVTEIAHLIRKEGLKLPKKTTKRIPLFERFWEKVKKTDTCWLWTGAKTKRGYGKITEGGDKGKTLLAHRIAWEIGNGKIPTRLEVCHKCDNPTCVRISHLFLGTHQENENDKVSKKRHTFGEKHNLAKLTLKQVEQIRKEYAKGNMTQYELAEKYGVHQPEIHRIISEKRWASI